MFKRSTLSSALGAVALVAVTMTGPVAAESAVNLKFAHFLPTSHAMHPDGLVPWAEAVTKASGGSITFTFFPAQQLGKAKDLYDIARDGIADVTWTAPGYSPGRFPVAGAGDLPFHISDAVSGSVAFDKWYRRHNAKETAGVKYCLSHVHDPGALHTKTKITHPSQMAGVKVRPATATIARFVSLLGGASVQVPAPEARDALSKGTADMLTFPWNTLRLFGIHNETTHHLDIPFYTTVLALYINQAKYDGMSDAQRAVIDAHCSPEWAGKIAQGWATWEQQGKTDSLADSTQTIHTPTAEETLAWQTAAEPLVAEWVAEVKAAGGDAEAIHADLVDTLKEHNALYE